MLESRNEKEGEESQPPPDRRAAADEILVTGEVAKRLPARIKRAYARSVALGGKTFELHRIKY